MLTRTLLIGLTAALVAGTAFAATGGTRKAADTTPSTAVIPFSVTGAVPQLCVVNSPTLTGGQLINFQTLNGTMLPLSQLANSQTLATNAASATVTFPAMCNYPHQIVLQSQNNGLYLGGATGGAVPQGFADGVPYTAVLTWGNVTSTFFVPATTRGQSQDTILVPTASTGNMQIQLTIQAGASNLAANSPLEAGTYTDTLFITLEPQ